MVQRTFPSLIDRSLSEVKAREFRFSGAFHNKFASSLFYKTVFRDFGIRLLRFQVQSEGKPSRLSVFKETDEWKNIA